MKEPNVKQYEPQKLLACKELFDDGLWFPSRKHVPRSSKGQFRYEIEAKESKAFACVHWLIGGGVFGEHVQKHAEVLLHTRCILV